MGPVSGCWCFPGSGGNDRQLEPAAGAADFDLEAKAAAGLFSHTLGLFWHTLGLFSHTLGLFFSRRWWVLDREVIPLQVEAAARGGRCTRGAALKQIQGMGTRRYVLSVDNDNEFRSRCE
jgi:hypothetical protein